MTQLFRLCLCCCLSLILHGTLSAAPKFEAKPDASEAELLAAIEAHGDKMTRLERRDLYPDEGPFQGEGQFVNINGQPYFKVTDQSFLPEDKRFPYPAVYFLVPTTETYALEPLYEGGILKNRKSLHDGVVTIRGNWAYEFAFHAFTLTWVDEVVAK